VLIVVSPISLARSGNTDGKSDKKIHFGGEYLDQEGQSLQVATRADLDQMYEMYIKQRVVRRPTISQQSGSELGTEAVAGAYSYDPDVQTIVRNLARSA